MLKENMLPVRVKTLFPNIVLGFELYIELPHKVLSYAQAEDSIGVERLESLNNKNVKKLYLNSIDESKYHDYLDRCLEHVMSSKDLTTKDKGTAIAEVSLQLNENLFEKPTEQRTYVNAKKSTENLSKVLKVNAHLVGHILSHNSAGKLSGSPLKDAIILKHSVDSSSLCISFANYLQLEADSIKLLSLAGLYHDIGYSEVVNKKLFFKPVEKMDLNDFTAYKLHPKIAVQRLQGEDFIDKDLFGLINKHEERILGKGFPDEIQKLTRDQEVLNICCHYSRNRSCLGMSASEAAEEITLHHKENFSTDLMENFIKFISDFI